MCLFVAARYRLPKGQKPISAIFRLIEALFWFKGTVICRSARRR